MNTPRGRSTARWVTLALLLVASLVAPARPAQAALATVTDVSVKEFGNKVLVAVVATRAVRYRVADWSGKPDTWVVLDVLGAELGVPAGELPYRSRDIARVRVGQFNSTTVRVVVELAGERSYTVQPVTGAYAVAIVIAGNGPSRPTASAQPVPPSATAQAQARPARFTLEFRDARLSDVMAALARLANLNVVVAPEAAERRVTIRLVNVSLDEALNLLTQPLGLGWTRVGGNIVVLPADRLPGEPLEIRYYRLQHASAEDVARQIEPLLFGRRLVAPQPAATPAPGQPQAQPPQAQPAAAPVVIERSQVAVDRRTNTLIVVASASDHQRVAQIVQQLDVAVPVSPVATRIYPLRWLNADLRAPEGGPAREIGAEMVALLKAHLSPSAIVTFDYQNNAVVVTAVEGDHQRAQQLLAQVDVPAQQVLIEASALDLSVDVARDLGLQWQMSVLNIAGSTPSQGQVFYNPSTGAIDFFVQINALISQGKGRLLANPRIVTKDGQAGEVFIGDQIPVVTGVTPQGVPQVVFIDAGVKLNITPKINPDGMITVRVLTEVGVARQFATGVGKSTRKAVTTLTVRDGSPIVIGGLIRTEERTTTIKIPLLGDIPIIGFLFRREQTTQSTSEVVFVVTPRSLPRSAEPRG